jgi:hypothetical protein
MTGSMEVIIYQPNSISRELKEITGKLIIFWYSMQFEIEKFKINIFHYIFNFSW